MGQVPVRDIRLCSPLKLPTTVLYALLESEEEESSQTRLIRALMESLDLTQFRGRLVGREVGTDDISESQISPDDLTGLIGSTAWFYSELGCILSDGSTQLLIQFEPDGDALSILVWGAEAKRLYERLLLAARQATGLRDA